MLGAAFHVHAVTAATARFKPTMTERFLRRLGIAGEDSDDIKTVRHLYSSHMVVEP